MPTNMLKRFWHTDDGAATVDWIVLTAALITFGIFIVNVVLAGATDPEAGIGAWLSATPVPEIKFE